MNMSDAIAAGYNPGEDYTPRPMTRRQYLRWIRRNGYPDSGYGTAAYYAQVPSEPPF